MSYAVVKRTDGSSVIVSNSVKDTGGGSHTADANALNSAGSPVAIFTASVPVNPVKVVNFRLSDVNKRYFRL